MSEPFDPKKKYSEQCYERHTLEKIPVALRRVIKNIEDKRIETDVYRDITGEMVIEMRAMLLGEKSADDERIRYPATWVQAFKLEYFPDWLLRFFPIVWTEYIIKHRITYPNLLKDRHPDCGKYIELWWLI